MRVSSNTCRICLKPMIRNVIVDHPILTIIGDSPVDLDMESGVVMAEDVRGRPSIGSAVRQELRIARIPIQQVNLMYVWLHPKSRDELDYNWQVKQLLAVAKGTPLLLCGSVSTKLYLGMNADDCACVWAKSDLTTQKIMPAPSLGTLAHGVVGEFRLALMRMAHLILKGK